MLVCRLIDASLKRLRGFVVFLRCWNKQSARIEIGGIVSMFVALSDPIHSKKQDSFRQRGDTF